MKMQKFIVLAVVAAVVLVAVNCGSSKKATASAPKLSYETDLQTVIATKCTPCHIPAKGGKKKAYDTYAAVKEDIDAMISRIELNPGEKGFMPFKGARLSDSVITVFKQWRADGLMEK